MVGIYAKAKKGLNTLADLSEKYGGVVDTALQLPVSQVVNRILPFASKGLDILNNTYEDYQDKKGSYGLGDFWGGLTSGRYFKDKSKEVKYSRPSDTHHRIELKQLPAYTGPIIEEVD
jgi:hypothetical protein